MPLLSKPAVFTSKKIFLFLSWGFLTLLLVREIKFEPLVLLFALSTFLLYTHILYGGYFLFKHGGLTKPTLPFLALLIYICLIKLVQSVDQIFSWYVILIPLFITAIIFHAVYKFYAKNVYLKEVCNFKIYIELAAIISGCLAILSYPWFKDNLWLSGVVNIIVIIALNWFILFKKNIYQTRSTSGNVLQ